MSMFWLPAQLATLAKVVELNGFSAAARALGVPKAAVSRAIADLETTLGIRVLNRTTRRLSLTEAGQLIYPNAQRLVEETDAARTQIRRWFAPPTGPLRVAADPTYGRILLAPLVPRFMESFPDIPLEVNLQSGIDKGPHHHVSKIRFSELHQRKINRDLDVGRPSGGLSACGKKYPLADLSDQAGFLGKRNKQIRQDQALCRMLPANQRLHAAYLLSFGIDYGLIVEFQLILLNCAT